MKMVTPLFMHPISLDATSIHSVVIENPVYFRRFIESLSAAIERDEGDIVVSHELETLAADKCLELITSFVPFTLNRKNLLQAVVKHLEKRALDVTNREQAQQIICAVTDYLNNLALDLPHAISFDNLSVGALLKASGITFEEEEETTLNKLLSYFRLVRAFDADRVMILVGLRAYFSRDELIPFFQVIHQEQFRVLLVDANAYQLLPDETRLLIDNDLCEVIKDDDFVF